MAIRFAFEHVASEAREALKEVVVATEGSGPRPPQSPAQLEGQEIILDVVAHVSHDDTGNGVCTIISQLQAWVER